MRLVNNTYARNCELLANTLNPGSLMPGLITKQVFSRDEEEEVAVKSTRLEQATLLTAKLCQKGSHGLLSLIEVLRETQTKQNMATADKLYNTYIEEKKRQTNQ